MEEEGEGEGVEVELRVHRATEDDHQVLQGREGRAKLLGDDERASFCLPGPRYTVAEA